MSVTLWQDGLMVEFRCLSVSPAGARWHSAATSAGSIRSRRTSSWSRTAPSHPSGRRRRTSQAVAAAPAAGTPSPPHSRRPLAYRILALVMCHSYIFGTCPPWLNRPSVYTRSNWVGRGCGCEWWPVTEDAMWHMEHGGFLSCPCGEPGLQCNIKFSTVFS